MIVPAELQNVVEIKDFASRLYITRYTECVASKIPTHVVDNLLIIVLEGEKKLVCGDYTILLTKGEFGLFKKGNYIMSQILSHDLYESLLIFIPDEYLKYVKQVFDKKVIYKMKDAAQVLYIHGIAGTHMRQEAEQVASLLQDNKGQYNEILKLKTKELLMYLIQDNSAEEIMAFINSCISGNRGMKEYMESNYAISKSVQDIADDLNMSISTFKRRFEENYGTTPGKWISLKRLGKAKILLETTDYPVTDICFLCGYESLSAFNTQFKCTFGITPGKVRSQILRSE